MRIQRFIDKIIINQNNCEIITFKKILHMLVFVQEHSVIIFSIIKYDNLGILYDNFCSLDKKKNDILFSHESFFLLKLLLLFFSN